MHPGMQPEVSMRTAPISQSKVIDPLHTGFTKLHNLVVFKPEGKESNVTTPVLAPTVTSKLPAQLLGRQAFVSADTEPALHLSVALPS